MAAPSIKGLGARRLARALGPRACAIALACAGLFAGWFAAGAGFVIGAMLDVARNEARSRRRIAAYLERPAGSPPPEPLAGYSAAACIALRGGWEGTADRDSRRALFYRFSAERIPPGGRARRDAERIVDVAARIGHADLPALARVLATSDAGAARQLLADWAYALCALGGGRLEGGAELALRAALGDCGLGARELLAARLAAFPGERDPWTVLGLPPGAPRSEIKRAYRRLSRLFHPDAAQVSGEPILGDEGEKFRELRSAYLELSSPSPVGEITR